MRAFTIFCIVLLVDLVTARRREVTVSNERLPVDQNGEKIITGEASVLKVTEEDGVTAFYFYFNNWGACAGVNCCDSDAGCASCCFDDPPHPMQSCSNPYLNDHTVQVYRTVDFNVWENFGVALPLANRNPGIEFRPCVVYNSLSNRYVMWYEDRGPDETGYAVATSDTPEGPFETVAVNVTMPGTGRIGDFNIFVDDDGSAYHVRTGFDIVKLNENYTGPEHLIASFVTPKRSEGPTMFKRDGRYYVTSGTDCCACIGGSSLYISSADALTGPWTFQGDIGSNQSAPFDPHSPYNYVTRAQGSAVFAPGGNSIVWLGNQWNSGLRETPSGPRNHDLLYWAPLSFDSEGRAEQLAFEANASFFVD